MLLFSYFVQGLGYRISEMQYINWVQSLINLANFNQWKCFSRSRYIFRCFPYFITKTNIFLILPPKLNLSNSELIYYLLFRSYSHFTANLCSRYIISQYFKTKTYILTEKIIKINMLNVQSNMVFFLNELNPL